MSVRGVLLSGLSRIIISPEGFIGGLKLLLQLFALYQWSSRVHPLDVPRNIRLDGGGKPYCSPHQLQGIFLGGIWCWTFLRQVSVDQNHLATK